MILEWSHLNVHPLECGAHDKRSKEEHAEGAQEPPLNRVRMVPIEINHRSFFLNIYS